MLLKFLRYGALLVEIAAFVVFAFGWSHTVAFLMLALGTSVHLHLSNRDLGHAHDDRHLAHQRLLELNDFKWVMDQLVHIGERDQMPKKLQDEAKRLQTVAGSITHTNTNQSEDDPLKYS